MNINVNKPLKTRCGYEVIIHTTTGKDRTYPLVGEYNDGDRWQVGRWSENGRHACCVSDARDLVNVLEYDRWIHINATGGSSFIYVNEESARKALHDEGGFLYQLTGDLNQGLQIERLTQ